jgi:hypothetical protein
MAQSKTDELFEMLRARGLRTRVARTLSDAAGAGRSGAASSQKAAENLIADLRKLADEIEDRIRGGGGSGKRAEAAKKAAATRKRNATKRSASAKKAAATRKRTTTKRASSSTSKSGTRRRTTAKKS